MEAWFTLAEVELALKNWKEALFASAKVLQLSGVKSSRESIQILPIRAQAYEGLGDYPNAIKAWTVAAKEMPDSTLPLVRRAACYAKVGDKKAQNRDLEQVKKVELSF
ncbi:MAG: hypothetical protein HC888_13590 [Candidatus Competibacteraceae bacterium]|nr:hypothetical protein [Candidatus Competibacteraceae bacterium]